MQVIRRATIEDAAVIHKLALEIWPQSYAAILAAEQIEYMLKDRYSTKELTHQIKENLQTYLLALEDTRPVGFASYSDDIKAETYRLHKLYCLPSTHGKGYGKALLNEIINEVRHLGGKTLELNVHRLNPAKSFYDKMGFEIAFEADIPMGPYFLNDYIMRKQL